MGIVLAASLTTEPISAQPAIMTVGTHSMIMKDDANFPGARKFSFNVRSGEAPVEHRVVAPAPESAGDPSLFGGTLTVYNGAGGGERIDIDLPAENWTRMGIPTDPRYVFASTTPVWKVYVKGSKISVRGGKSLWPYTLDEASQGAIAVRLTLGSDLTWCSAALPAPPTSENDRPNKFRALRLQPAPNDCLPVPQPAHVAIRATHRRARSPLSRAAA